ncbi:MAG TPA: ECF transporter S component [Candidatus Eubacterium faecale]|uniref:ECF transporter S component n=1 Tax=Candidatus Eubacterium faecale TaxID=2838568 RepID=A0A9D2MGT4_9FIRM|nr:ECF transporter S component [Candidatus Eubacterium faecale]
MNKTTKNICFSAMFAAMIFALTMLHVPIGAGGYIHVGDSVIYIAALLMGGPWSFISAAIGTACADLVSGVAVYAIPSAIIKVLIAVPFVLIAKKDTKLLSIRTAAFTILSGIITILGYFLTDLVVYRAGAVADLPANVIQAVGSAVVFVILAFALDRADIKNRFKKEIEK